MYIYFKNIYLFYIINLFYILAGASLPPDQMAKAQKYCKFAGSALQYEDVPTAIMNLQKALSLLTTGKED